MYRLLLGATLRGALILRGSLGRSVLTLPFTSAMSRNLVRLMLHELVLWRRECRLSGRRVVFDAVRCESERASHGKGIRCILCELLGFGCLPQNAGFYRGF